MESFFFIKRLQNVAGNNGSTTSAKLADAAVTTAKIANSAVTAVKLDSATVLDQEGNPVVDDGDTVTHLTIGGIRFALATGNVVSPEAE